MIDWEKYPNFSEAEFRCKHTGECRMQVRFLDKLQAVRAQLGHPIIITSGYRHPSHPIESAKAKPGEHSLGLCADVFVPVEYRYKLITLAILEGLTRIGVNHGSGSQFIHLGCADNKDGLPSPRIWSY